MGGLPGLPKKARAFSFPFELTPFPIANPQFVVFVAYVMGPFGHADGQLRPQYEELLVQPRFVCV